jgi:hypothetical protein
MLRNRVVYYTIALVLQLCGGLLALYYIWLMILSPVDILSLDTLFRFFQVFGLIVLSQVVWSYENEFRRENLNLEEKALLQMAIDNGLSILSCSERSTLEEVMVKLKSRFQI